MLHTLPKQLVNLIYEFAAYTSPDWIHVAEHKYGKKLTYKEFQEIMTPENADDYHEFVEHFAECEEQFKKYPISFGRGYITRH